MGFVKEFKEFAVKGNVVDLAVAVVIGAAFSKIINSFIEDIITPLLLKPALDAANLSDIEKLTAFGTVKYGLFLSAVISFIIVAIVLFLVIKGLNSFKKKEEAKPAAPPAPSKEEVLLTEIRDILKNK
ncbi:mechanosensitive ion channel protein MscL [Pelobium manganitolerans]|uniref:Large-conductance mechanosensitive channel n=1 Tax=Pelobium manganitolerans TaxID=1842495 RepID=A0A419S5D5_9SPHI|nr:large conductance mechanosensitive channel protein MscL [Pelobium manganitolerans]RKD15316.1 mechanosensitive ion channel protein MscL [Pelobium manganitolerans]